MKKANTIKPLPEKSAQVKKPGLAVEPAGWTEGSSGWNAPPSATGHAQSPSPIALEARQLVVRYGSHAALSDITFKLHNGDTLGLLGLNGAGKSTLLRVLAGALAPDQGSVHVCENELYENQITARKDIGYAPDKPAVYPEFRVNEYLNFIARMRRIKSSRIASTVSDVMELCGLSDAKRRIIGNLSTGFQQRINLAQALIHSPRVLILDEPTNGLDPVQIMEMRELITSLASHQVTIFSSHQLSEVNAICNRVILLHNGTQMIDSSLDHLSHRDNVTHDLTLASNADFHLKDLPGISEACSTSPCDWVVTGQSMTSDALQTMLTSRGLQIEKIETSGNFLEQLFRNLSLAANHDSSGQNTDRYGVNP